MGIVKNHIWLYSPFLIYVARCYKKEEMLVFGIKDTLDNPVLFAPWSIIHFAIGMAAFPALERINIDMNRFLLWAILHGVYELKDIAGAYYATCKWFIACDKSFVNSVGDEIMALLGYALAKSLNIHSLWSGLSIIVVAFLILGSPLFTESQKWF